MIGSRSENLLDRGAGKAAAINESNYPDCNGAPRISTQSTLVDSITLLIGHRNIMQLELPFEPHINIDVDIIAELAGLESGPSALPTFCRNHKLLINCFSAEEKPGLCFELWGQGRHLLASSRDWAEQHQRPSDTGRQEASDLLSRSPTICLWCNPQPCSMHQPPPPQVWVLTFLQFQRGPFISAFRSTHGTHLENVISATHLTPNGF